MIFVLTAFLLGSAFIGGAYAQDVVYSENFDSGMGAWSGQWGIATSNYHSPPNSLADSPSGNYLPDANVSVTLTSDIDLSTYPGATVDFWTKYDIETGFDYVYMYVSSNGGQTWNDFHTFNGEGVAWHNFEADLGGYAGESVRFKFTLVTDGAYEVDGMYIDDFTVTGLTGDNSPPLIIHEGPTVFTSVPEEFTVVATITDFSGVNSAWVTYTVDNGQDEIANTDSTVGDVYYFTIPMSEAGAHINYTIFR